MNNDNTSIDDVLSVGYIFGEDGFDFDIDSELDILLNEADEEENPNENQEDTSTEEDNTSQEEEDNTENNSENAETEENSEDGGEDTEGSDNTEETSDGEDNTEESMQETEEEISENKDKLYYFTIFSDMYDNIKLFIEKVGDLMEIYTEEHNKTLLISIQDELYNLKQDLELLLIDKIKIMPIENINIVYISVSSKAKILLDIIDRISSSEHKESLT